MLGYYTRGPNIVSLCWVGPLQSSRVTPFSNLSHRHKTCWGTVTLMNTSFCYPPKTHCTTLGSILVVGRMNAPLTKLPRVLMQHSREAILARETCAQTLLARGQASEALHFYQVRKYETPQGSSVQLTFLGRGAIIVARIKKRSNNISCEFDKLILLLV